MSKELISKSRLMYRKAGERIEGKLKCAIFGTGYWSTLQIPAWLETNEVEIVAVYNRTLEKGEKIANKYGIKCVYSDAEKLIMEEEIDFADIITEAPGHEWLTLLAAKHHIPVICQKPMAHSIETSRTMVTECKKAGVPFFIHENYRWQPHFRAVRKAVAEGHIGKLIRARIQMYTGGAEGWAVQPFLATLKHMALIDAGPHIFDLCRFMFGEVESVYAHTVRTFAGCEGEDTAVIMVDAGGIPVVCEICEYCDSKVFVEGVKGTIVVDNDNIMKITQRDGHVEILDTKTYPRHMFAPESDWNLHGGASIHSIIECNRSFINAFRNGTLPETTGEDNYKTMCVVFAAIRSVEEHRLVSLQEFDGSSI